LNQPPGAHNSTVHTGTSLALQTFCVFPHPPSHPPASPFPHSRRRYGGTFRIQFGQFFGLCPRGVFVNDPASVKHILQTGFQAGAYGKGPFFKIQYKVGQGRVCGYVCLCFLVTVCSGLCV
jgi:hypothetical protein